ncbi:MAG: chorismate mutase [Candidatus Izemoplasmatales bacterium]|nr:chorismate mutase [Candidatus Izemoplasmatales bacterium]
MDLKDYRNQIDTIDATIRQLFEERMLIVAKIADLKMREEKPVYDHQREDEVIRKNLDSVEHEEYRQYYEDVLRTIMRVSKEMQKELILRNTL